MVASPLALLPPTTTSAAPPLTPAFPRLRRGSTALERLWMYAMSSGILHLVWTDCVWFWMSSVFVGSTGTVPLGCFCGLGCLRIWIYVWRLRLSRSVVALSALLDITFCFRVLAGFRTWGG